MPFNARQYTHDCTVRHAITPYITLRSVRPLDRVTYQGKDHSVQTAATLCSQQLNDWLTTRNRSNTSLATRSVEYSSQFDRTVPLQDPQTGVVTSTTQMVKLSYLAQPRDLTDLQQEALSLGQSWPGRYTRYRVDKCFSVEGVMYA